MRRITPFLVCLALTACGDDAEPPVEINSQTVNNTNNVNNVELDTFVLACDDTESPVGLAGSVYVDLADTANSMYNHASSSDREGIPGVEVQLLSGEGETWTTTTCDDGTFRFGELPQDLAFFVDPILDGRVTTTNDTSNLFKAMESGSTNVVVFGDSIPHYGPEPWFPSVLDTRLEALGEVETTNIAVPGTKSYEWLPGTALFNMDLLPAVKEADLIVFSLGGNDVLEFVQTLQGSANPAEQLGQLQPVVDEIKGNLHTIIDRIQLTNPDADIVWILYPNYAVTEQWKAFLGTYANAAKSVLTNVIMGVREDLASQDRLVMVDMFEATKDVDLGAMMIDPLHLNEDGHVFYAEEIARALGIVEAGTTPLSYDFGVEPQ